MPVDEADPRHADFLLGDLFMRNVYSVCVPFLSFALHASDIVNLDSTMVTSPRLGLSLQQKQALISDFYPVLTNLK